MLASPGDNRTDVDPSHSAVPETEEWGGDEAKSVSEFISVAEVYEIAAAIGKEFEVLIDRHGGEAVCGLMPKVIHVLEELEEQAARRDGQLAEVAALQAAVERLEADKVARTQQRIKDEQVNSSRSMTTHSQLDPESFLCLSICLFDEG